MVSRRIYAIALAGYANDANIENRINYRHVNQVGVASGLPRASFERTTSRTQALPAKTVAAAEALTLWFKHNGSASSASNTTQQRIGAQWEILTRSSGCFSQDLASINRTHRNCNPVSSGINDCPSCKIVSKGPRSQPAIPLLTPNITRDRLCLCIVTMHHSICAGCGE